ncbi:hypothetical protein [Gemmatimonas sp.]|uniref:hypothetical protein n=1 Tax=Gemmatimonas sp. TaxID=1962908 RepID=UPI0037C04F81
MNLLKSGPVTCLMVLGAFALAACEPSRVVDGGVEAGAPVVQSVKVSNGLLEFTEDEFRMKGSNKGTKITPSLRKMLADVAASSAFVTDLETRVKASPSGKLNALRARGQINAASQRESALDRIRGAGLSGVGPIAPASTAMYTCTDLEIAIYEQTELYHAAEDAFYEELATMTLDGIVDGDIPGVSDVGHLWTAAYDVWMWHSSLTILATLYGANDCW